MSREILFRQINEPVASWSVPGLRWAVECWADETAYPVGVAWVTHCDTVTYLDWITVEQDYRREGIATAILDACLERWPQLAYEGTTDDGEAFTEWYNKARGRAGAEPTEGL